MICLFYRGLCRYVIFIVLMFFSCAEDPVPITDTPLVYTIATASSVGGGITPSQTIEKGKTVSITALPNEHYQFKAWDSNCGQFNDQEATIRFEVTEHCLITAVFEKIYYKMTATAGEGGSIQGLSTNGYPQGQAITLTAIHEKHYVFSQWDIEAAPGHACPSISNPQTPIIRFIVQGPCGLKATFLKVPRTTITTSVSQGGQITETQIVEHGQAVSITVALEEDYTFKAWSGTCGEFNPLETTITFTATKDCEISAIVEQKTYTITALASEGGSIMAPLVIEKTKGQTVSFMAVADQHHEFAQWKTDPSSDCPDLLEPMKATISFEVIGNCVLEAVFLKASRTIITSVNKGGTITPTKKIPHGQSVSITVSIDEGYRFQAWTSDCGDFSSHRATTITFMATKDCQVTAMLEEEPLPVDDCSNPLEIAPNGHTLRVKPACESHRTTLVGQIVTFHGVDYTIVDNEKIKEQRNQGRSMAHIVTTFVTDMRGLFSRNQGCDEHNKNCQFINSTFNDNISTWDVSQVTTMDLMFSGAQAFNQDIGHWDVSSVTSMKSMFGVATVFDQDISKWDVSKVTDMNHMFVDARAFDQDLSRWNVSSVTIMSSMFHSAWAFNQNISGWNTMSVKDMTYMFMDAIAFNQDLSGWNVNNVTNCSSFSNVSAFTKRPLFSNCNP